MYMYKIILNIDILKVINSKSKSKHEPEVIIERTKDGY